MVVFSSRDSKFALMQEVNPRTHVGGISMAKLLRLSQLSLSPSLLCWYFVQGFGVAVGLGVGVGVRVGRGVTVGLGVNVGRTRVYVGYGV